MNLNQCNSCKFKASTAIFELCTHEKSEYRNPHFGRVEYHTRTHMLKRYANGCTYYVTGISRS